MNEPEPIRVLHCPTTVGGNAQQLARAERELGLQSISVTVDQNYLNYAVDEVLSEPNRGPVRRELKRFGLLRRALRDFDIVHYNFGSTILPHRASPGGAGRTGLARLGANLYKRVVNMRELALLKRAGKGIVVTYQGDDARQKDFCLRNFQITFAREVDDLYYPPGSDELKRAAITKFAKYADRIYTVNPDLLYVLPAGTRFLPYAVVDLREWTPAARPAGRSPRMTVLHAPSHRGVKGTAHVLRAVARLKNEDRLQFDLVLVEDVSREQARQAYERADLVIDQVLGGWYGALAVEVMALGKPVISYIRDEDLKFIPEQMRKDLPVINATPATLYEVMKRWLTARRDDLAGVGSAGRAYVQKWHDPLTVAAALKDDYEAILASKRGGDPR